MNVEEVGPTSVELSWNEQSEVESYQVSYMRIRGVIYSCARPYGSMLGTDSGVTLDNLEEDSIYSVTVTAMRGDDSFPTTIQITTVDAGKVHIT